MVIPSRQVNLFASHTVVWSIDHCLAGYSAGIAATLMIAGVRRLTACICLESGAEGTSGHAYMGVSSTIADDLLAIGGCLCATEICSEDASARAVLVVGDAMGHDVFVGRVRSLLIVFSMSRVGLIALGRRRLPRRRLVVFAYRTHVQSVLHRI